jgi:CxxC motif-containing protein (DUF1111 family)
VRRNDDHPDVITGESLFGQIKCVSCHISDLMTAESDIEVLSNKVFHPYTDLLLHDMGDELNDNYTEGTALNAEWRTPPLWGLGLSKESQGGQFFLMHDGRASSIGEAILLHGGEAEDSKIRYLGLSDIEKGQLQAFLESL